MMRISIVTACLNNHLTVEQAIQSVIYQTHTNLEHILVDGGSTDGTLEIVERYTRRISRIISGRDRGLYDALNKGIQAATGDVVGFLHADDTYADRMAIQKVIEFFESQKVDSIYGDLIYVDKQNADKVIRYWRAGAFDLAKMRSGWMPPHPALFVKRSIYEKYGLFDLSYSIAADYDLMMRFLVDRAMTVAYLPEVLVKMRTGGTSNRNLANIFKKSAEDLRVLKQHQISRPLMALMRKNLSKIPQWFDKPVTEKEDRR